MSGPFPFARQMAAIDDLVSGPPSWDMLTQSFFPAKLPDNFDPGEDMKLMLAAFYRTAEGRRIVDWLADLTVRAPYPHVGQTLESAGLAAAKHEARCAVGHALLRAIAEGTDLWLNRKGAET